MSDRYILEPITVAGEPQCSDLPGLGLAPPLDLDVGSAAFSEGKLVAVFRGEGWMLDR